MYITKTLVKAKMDESIVKLTLKNEVQHVVRVMKLMGTEIEAHSLEKGKFNIVVNSDLPESLCDIKKIKIFLNVFVKIS